MTQETAAIIDQIVQAYKSAQPALAACETDGETNAESLRKQLGVLFAADPFASAKIKLRPSAVDGIAAWHHAQGNATVRVVLSEYVIEHLTRITERGVAEAEKISNAAAEG